VACGLAANNRGRLRLKGSSKGIAQRVSFCLCAELRPPNTRSRSVKTGYVCGDSQRTGNSLFPVATNYSRGRVNCKKQRGHPPDKLPPSQRPRARHLKRPIESSPSRENSIHDITTRCQQQCFPTETPQTNASSPPRRPYRYWRLPQFTNGDGAFGVTWPNYPGAGYMFTSAKRVRLRR
jgi:hypothetical protein